MTGDFNPRPPRGGRRAATLDLLTCETFQSTPPARGATEWILFQVHFARHFNPHPREGGDAPAGVDTYGQPISIHAPREGGDVHDNASCYAYLISIHAPREGGDPMTRAQDITVLKISIHAPREGGDPENIHELYSLSDFNPRPREGGDCTYM